MGRYDTTARWCFPHSFVQDMKARKSTPKGIQLNMGWIYRWTHIESGMAYVGQTHNFDKRTQDHSAASGNCRYFYNAIRKHGVEAFEIDIICQASNDELLNALEMCYIKVLNTLYPNGYNLREGGDGGKHSSESIQRISNSKIGHEVSKATREKISQSLIGRESSRRNIPLSDEHRRNIGKACKGRVPWNKGKTDIYSQETRLLMGAKNKGRKQNRSVVLRRNEGNRKYHKKKRFVVLVYAVWTYYWLRVEGDDT